MLSDEARKEEQHVQCNHFVISAFQTPPSAQIKAGELKDRSMMGNASCLRNEKVAGGAIIWTPEYVLPHMGNFECDFVYMIPNRPT